MTSVEIQFVTKAYTASRSASAIFGYFKTYPGWLWWMPPSFKAQTLVPLLLSILHHTATAGFVEVLPILVIFPLLSDFIPLWLCAFLLHFTVFTGLKDHQRYLFENLQNFPNKKKSTFILFMKDLEISRKVKKNLFTKENHVSCTKKKLHNDPQ